MLTSVQNMTPVDNSNESAGNANATTQADLLHLESRSLLLDAVEFYMNYAVIVIAISGAATNALVLYALVVQHAQESKKRAVNLMIINQNLLDLCCCVTIVICLCIRVSNIYLTGTLGYILCIFFLSENIAYCLLNASVVNLMGLTVERYLKVVYPFWSKKNLKRWMIHGAVVFSWVAGILSISPVIFVTSAVDDGICGTFLLWENLHTKNGYMIWNLFSFFILPVIVFVYCYGHIVFVMRKQMRVMAGHNVEASAQSASQAQSKRVKWNVIKTMIIVSTFFIICWCPFNISIIAVEHLPESSDLIIAYVVTLFLPYVNISLNPFIYATKHEGVRRILARMIVCHKHGGVAAVSGTAGTSGNIDGSGTNKTQTTVALK